MYDGFAYHNEHGSSSFYLLNSFGEGNKTYWKYEN